MARLAVKGFDDWILLLGRLAVAVLFVPSGFDHLTHVAGFAHFLAGKGLPVAITWAIVAAFVEFVGGVMVGLGYRVRFAALLLIAFTIAASLLSHHYWTMQGSAALMNRVQFMKNIAIIGGLLLLFARGPGTVAIDGG